MCTYICKDSVTGYFLYLGKKLDSQPLSLFKLIGFPTVVPITCSLFLWAWHHMKFVCRFEDYIAPQLTFDDKNLETRFTNKFLCMSSDLIWSCYNVLQKTTALESETIISLVIAEWKLYLLQLCGVYITGSRTTTYSVTTE